MNLARSILALAVMLLAVAPARSADSPPPRSSGAGPIYTRQGLFSIPFQVDSQMGVEQPVEVQLFVSEDHGKKWRLETKVEPPKKEFSFDTGGRDGEYWFSIRTVDRQGRSHPDGTHQPQLRVVVDTMAPRLELNATRGEGGEVNVRWKVLDTGGLKSDSFKIEYQASGENWQPMAIDAQNQRSLKYTLVGDGTWWPAAANGQVLLRGTITDEAGNPAVSQVQLHLDRVAAIPPAGYDREGSTANRNDAPIGSGRKVLEWRAESTEQSLTQSLPGQADAFDGQYSQDSSWRGTRQGLADQDRHWNGSQRVPAQMVAQPFGRTDVGNVDPNVVPPGERPQMVNVRRFELDYEVEASGNASIAKVELWGTRDGGRHWSSLGIDNDSQSPMAVTVDGEGIYGFRVVAETSGGLAGKQPQEGDLPEMWIGVDLTKPLVRLAGVEAGVEADELVLRWEASDTQLEGRPISILWSDRPRGPWAPVATELENTGSYSWRPDNRTPEKVYFRIEARDAAGNVGAFETNAPILLNRQRPQGRIRGVRPIGSSARRPEGTPVENR